MNKKELQAITHAAAKNIKTEDDLKDSQQMPTKITVEAALNAELDDHLGFERHEQSEADNNRNGMPVRLTERKLASSSSIHHATELGVSSPSPLKNTSVDLLPWTTRLFSCMPRA